jgi:integrase/recombinase XerD
MKNSTFKSYLQSKRQRNTSVNSNLQMVERFEDWMKKQNLEKEQLTVTDILNYLEHLKKQEVKQKTQAIYLNSLKHYTQFLNNEALNDISIQHLTIKGVKRNTLHNILNLEQLEAIYQNYPTETVVNKRNKVILSLLIYQGITTGELSMLNVNNLHLMEGKIQIPPHNRNQERVLKLEAFQILLLDNYVKIIRSELVQDESGKQLILTSGTSSKLHNLLTKLMQDLRKKHPQLESYKQLRASVITNWLNIHHLRRTQYLAGHRFISSTERYQVEDLASLKSAIDEHQPQF